MRTRNTIVIILFAVVFCAVILSVYLHNARIARDVHHAPTNLAKEDFTREAVLGQSPTAASDAILKNPDDVSARMALVHRTIMQKDYKTVVTQLREVTRIQPDNRKAIYLLGLTLEKMGHKDQAIVEMKKLATQNDDWGQAAQRHLDH